MFFCFALEVVMCKLFFKYFIKQKKNILFFIVIIILGFGTSSLKNFENNKTNKEKIERCKRNIEEYKNELEHYKNELEKDNISEEDKELIEEYQKIIPKYIEESKEYIKSIEDSNWQYLYDDSFKHLKDPEGRFASIQIGDSYNVNETTIEITFETLTYLKKHNIPSALPLFLQRTEFDQPRSSEENKALDYHSKKTLIGTSHRVWDFFTNNLVLIYTFIIVVTFGILFSKLEDSQNKTIRFLRTSGASKLRIVLSGLLTGGILTIILGLLIPAIFFGIEFLISGSSSFKYPITTYIVKSDYFSLMSFGYKIVPISDVLTKSLILFLLYGSCKILVIGICILTILLICIAFIQDRNKNR